MKCRVCDSKDLECVIDLGIMPWGNHFLKKEEVGLEPSYPLRVLYCHDCQTSQLDYTVKKEVMFSNHTYLSGVTKSLAQHFKDVAIAVDERFFKNQQIKSVLDIGSNDGTQLKEYQKLGYEVLGIEASQTTAKIANENGVPTHHEFFNLESMQKIGKKFDVFNASGVFFHLEELHSVCEGIQFGLSDDGVFVVQFIYMKNMMENCAFDQVYHEHLLYYNLATIERLLERHGLRLFDAYLSPIHGGSIIAYVSHTDSTHQSTERLLKLKTEEDASGCNKIEAYQKFAQEIERFKEKTLTFLNKCKEEGKTVYGLGAPVKGNTLLNYFGIGTDLIPFLVEKNELRRDLYSPGMHIPLIMEHEITTPPDVYFVLAWNFKKEILANNQHLIDQGVEFYFPVDPTEIKS